VVGANHLGDLLYRSNALKALSTGLPDAEIHYLAAPETSGLLHGNPAITKIWPWMRSDSPLDMAPEHFEALKNFHFDALLATNSGRYWPELKLGIRLAIPNRAGYIWKGFSGWVTHPIPIHYPQPYPAYFRDYVAYLTGQPSNESLRPRLFPDAQEVAEAKAVWTTVNEAGDKPVLACFMTTRQSIGALPSEMVGHTLQEVAKRLAVRLVLMGAAADGKLLGQVNQRFGLNARVVAGVLKPGALSCFLSRCCGVVTADSGPRHLANAGGVPVFFFRNLAGQRVETGAYVSSEIDLCPMGLECLNDTEQRRVLSAISPVVSAIRIVEGIEAHSKKELSNANHR